MEFRDTRIGKGQLIASNEIENALEIVGQTPAFAYSGDANLLSVHRHLPDGDVYYVDNRNNKPVQTDSRFHVVGRTPELWHADIGKSEPVSYRTEGNSTIVPLSLLTQESVFIVFREIAKLPYSSVAVANWIPVTNFDKLLIRAGRAASKVWPRRPLFPGAPGNLACNTEFRV